MKLAVSICIPTYNGERYLREAMESALGQHFGDLEILIIDDCSSDHTMDIVSEYSQRDRRVRVLSNDKNVGLVSNWNRCILEARGEWIKFLFQDDVLALDCVEVLLREATETARPLVACFRDFIFEEDIDAKSRELYVQQQLKVAHWFAAPRLNGKEFSGLLLSEPPRNLVGEPTVTMFRRDLSTSIGFFDRLLVHLCDAEYWNRIATTYGIAMVRRPLAKFRVHGASMTAENASMRRFRSEALDQVVLTYRYLFDDAYADLRLTMDAHGRGQVWRNAFWDRCHYSRAFAKEQQSLGNGGPLKDWEHLVAQLPAIDDRPMLPVLRRIVRRLCRAPSRT